MAKQLWPSWRWGPNGASAIFQSEDDVPTGWVDHPSKAAEKDREQAELENGGEVVEMDVEFTPSEKLDVTPAKRAPRKLKGK